MQVSNIAMLQLLEFAKANGAQDGVHINVIPEGQDKPLGDLTAAEVDDLIEKLRAFENKGL